MKVGDRVTVKWRGVAEDGVITEAVEDGWIVTFCDGWKREHKEHEMRICQTQQTGTE